MLILCLARTGHNLVTERDRILIQPVRILLIRHGPSAHSVAAWRPISRSGMEEWRSDYDAAGIARGSAAPATIRARVLHVDLTVASDLPRAVMSAGHLWPERQTATSPLFREAPLRIPALGGVSIPLALWALCIHAHWMIDIVRGRDMTEDVRTRCSDAADWCVQACRDRGPTSVVAVVTHGVFRRALARMLIERGWTMQGRRSYAPWSVWELASMHGA